MYQFKNMPSGVQQTSIRQNKYLIWNLKSKKYIYRIKNKEACSKNSLMTLIGRTLKDNNIAVVFLCTFQLWQPMNILELFQILTLKWNTNPFSFLRLRSFREDHDLPKNMKIFHLFQCCCRLCFLAFLSFQKHYIKTTFY